MAKTDLPPLHLVINRWKGMGEFYFFKRFFDELHASVLTGPQAKPMPVVKKAILSQLVERISALLKFCWLLLQCAVLPKGKILVFNHSGRIRRGLSENRPVYLSSALVDSDLIVFEDKAIELKYSFKVSQLDAHSVNRVAEMIASLVSAFYRWRLGIQERDIVNFYIKRSLWRFILRQLKPRGVRLFVWYGKEAILSAAKSMGIEVADVQHGIIYASHPMYGLEKIRHISSIDALLPDVCFVYGDYWKQLLVQSGWSEERVKVIGYFLDTAEAQSAPVSQPYILYTSQPHTNAIITQHIISIVEACISRGVHILIAAHPMEDATGYQDIKSENVTVCTVDSYDLMRDCIVHISVSSTLLWEAMVFQKSSYVLDFGREAMDLMSDFVGFGLGRPLAIGQFPEPFALPVQPPADFFFRHQIDRAAFAASN